MRFALSFQEISLPKRMSKGIRYFPYLHTLKNINSEQIKSIKPLNAWSRYEVKSFDQTSDALNGNFGLVLPASLIVLTLYDLN